VLPAVDERFLGGTDQRLRMGAGLVRGGEGVGDALACGVGGALGNSGEPGVDGAPVAGRHKGSEHTDTYPTGVKIPDAQIKALHDTGALHRHDWHPEWNYTPNPPRN
jgi:hypothetical protein